MFCGIVLGAFVCIRGVCESVKSRVLVCRYGRIGKGVFFESGGALGVVVKS